MRPASLASPSPCAACRACRRAPRACVRGARASSRSANGKRRSRRSKTPPSSSATMSAGEASSWMVPRLRRSSWAGKTCRGGSSARSAVHQGEFEAAAKLLASAPGLGWSDSEHPGHMLFHVFCQLLGGGSAHSRWAATVRQEYCRYPALRAELEGRLGSS